MQDCGPGVKGTVAKVLQREVEFVRNKKGFSYGCYGVLSDYVDSVPDGFSDSKHR